MQSGWWGSDCPGNTVHRRGGRGVRVSLSTAEALGSQRGHTHTSTHTQTQIHTVFTCLEPPRQASSPLGEWRSFKVIFFWLDYHVVLGFGRSMTMGAFMGRKLTVQAEALTNVVVPSVIMPYPAQHQRPPRNDQHT